jgi:hypothetical protein
MSSDTLSRLTANAAMLVADATVAQQALAAGDYDKFAHFLGRVRGGTADCFNDGLSLAPDPASFQTSVDDGQQGE